MNVEADAITRIHEAWDLTVELLDRRGGIGQIPSGDLAHIYSWQDQRETLYNYHVAEYVNDRFQLMRKGSQHRSFYQFTVDSDGIRNMKTVDFLRWNEPNEVMVMFQGLLYKEGAPKEGIKDKVMFNTTDFAEGDPLSPEQAWLLDEVVLRIRSQL